MHGVPDWFPWARQLSLDDSAQVGFLCDKASVLRDTIRGTLCALKLCFLLAKVFFSSERRF